MPHVRSSLSSQSRSGSPAAGCRPSHAMAARVRAVIRFRLPVARRRADASGQEPNTAPARFLPVARQDAWFQKGRPRSFLRAVADLDAEGAEFAVQVRALHADALGEQPDLAAAQLQLLLQVGALEVLARLAHRQ